MTSGDTAGNSPIDWGSLRSGYGSAERVPELLLRAEEAGADSGEAWDDLWSHLCHQGTVYTASYAAVPTLAVMCQRQQPRGYMAPLHLVASILASNDAPEGAEELRDRFVVEVDQLRVIAERCVELAEHDVEFIYGIETLAAFEGRGVWSRNLSHLANGEVPLECVTCGENLLVQIEELPATVTCWDASQAPTTMEPHEDRTSSEERLIALAEANNRTAVAAKLRFLFGRVNCPECTANFPLREAFA